jgi:hypothetical protein
MAKDMLSLSLRRVGCVVGLSLAFVSSAFAIDRRVPQDFPTIQDAVNAAVNGDDIVVSPGNWTGFSVGGKTLRIRSTGSFATTRITSQCWINSAPNGFEIENMTILGAILNLDSTALTFDRVRAASVSVILSGTAQVALVDSELNSSGIYPLSGNNLPGNHAITNSSFRNNAYFHPRGTLQVTNSQFFACGFPISVDGAVTVVGSEFQGGIGSNLIRGASVIVSDSSIRNFIGSGAVFATGATTVTNSAFTGIRFNPNSSNIYGGAISAGDTLIVSSSSFIDCAGGTPQGVGAIYGGAISGRSNAPVTVSDCTFTDCNTSVNSSINVYGGAIQSFGPLDITESTFSNCGGTAAIQGGAIYSQSSSVVLTDCVFVGNSTRANSGGGGGAMFFFGDASITRCRFSSNSADRGGALLYVGGVVPVATAFIRECFFSGNTASQPNSGDDLRAEGSSAIAFLSQNTFCALEAQACSGFYFEKGPNTFGADCADDCDGDGLPDQYELKIGLATDCNDNGIPDSCDFASGEGADCNNNDILDICEIAAGTGADCNGNGILDACEPDCDGDGIPNSCEIAAGAPDCDANGVPDSCQSDCNNDGVIDACEIAAGAADCNTNGIPDSCEIANGSVADFNKDGIPDTCQPGMQYAGLELEIVPIVNRGLDDLFPQTAICYRLYARTTVEGAAVVGLFGNNAHPLSINAAGGFWQSPFGGDLASQIPCNLSGVLPSAKYDSWFTVGLTCSAGNSVQNTGLDLTAFNNGGGINDNDGIIFVQPGAAQSIAGSSKRVLLAQLTTNSAVLPTGFIDVVGRSASGTLGWEAYNQAIPVPALVDCNNNGQQDAFEIALGTVRDCNQSGIPDTCEFPSASTDCNNNGIPDLCDVTSAFSLDINGNFVPDECECSGDVDGNGVVDVDDIIDVIASWGALGDNPADVNNDDVVGAADLAIVLAGYGNCL